jgi:hypothetical protein
MNYSAPGRLKAVYSQVRPYVRRLCGTARPVVKLKTGAPHNALLLSFTTAA